MSLIDAKLLIVDDDEDLLSAMKEELENHFSTILSCDSGFKALEILKLEKVDCVITDFKMPQMNGLELIDKLNQTYSSLPLILLTGNGADPSVLKAIENGRFDYVDKPFKMPVLINRIYNALILPKLEALIGELVKIEFPHFEMARFSSVSQSERLKIIFALDATLRTRLLVKEGRRAI